MPESTATSSTISCSRRNRTGFTSVSPQRLFAKSRSTGLFTLPASDVVDDLARYSFAQCDGDAGVRVVERGECREEPRGAHGRRIPNAPRPDDHCESCAGLGLRPTQPRRREDRRPSRPHAAIGLRRRPPENVWLTTYRLVGWYVHLMATSSCCSTETTESEHDDPDNPCVNTLTVSEQRFQNARGQPVGPTIQLSPHQSTSQRRMT